MCLHRSEPLRERLFDAISLTVDYRFCLGLYVSNRVDFHALADLPQNILHLVKSERFLVFFVINEETYSIMHSELRYSSINHCVC